jgi:hypothetical protein
MPPLEDLDRFFHHLGRNVAAIDHSRLRHPLSLLEIRQTIIPYRASRRALQLESSEEYELVLMRLCAGEGGFARTEPAEVHAKFVAEALSSNPDLTIVQRHEDSALILNEARLIRALTPTGDSAFAPPVLRSSVIPQPIKASAASAQKATGKSTKKGPVPANCRGCGGKLPQVSNLKFCPECGESQTRTHCAVCDTKLHPTWKHCVACGLAVNSH